MRIGVEYQAHARYDTTVPRLILVLRDLYPTRLDQATRASLPRLPALERWLAHADTRTARRRLAAVAMAGIGPGARAPPPGVAAVAGAAVPDLPTDRPVWLATPVHFVAGLDTVRLHPAGLLELCPMEQQALAVDFARVFTGSGCTLHATGRRELLLSGGGSAASGTVRSHDPAQWLGADPRDGLPAGEGSATLRRLGAELEMWLHEHPVNACSSRARPARRAMRSGCGAEARRYRPDRRLIMAASVRLPGPKTCS